MKKLLLISAVALGMAGYVGASAHAAQVQIEPGDSELRLLMAADGAVQNNMISQADAYLQAARARLANDGSPGARQHVALIGEAMASLAQNQTERARQYIGLATSAPLVYDPTIEAPLSQMYSE